MVPYSEIFARQFAHTPQHLPPNAKDESRAPEIVAGNAICQIVGTVFFLMRAYSRFFMINAWKLEDSVLAAAWMFATAFSVCQYVQVSHGAGRHLGFILLENPSDTVESQKWAYTAQIVALPALGLPKLSICLTYLRIFHSDVLGRRMIKALIYVVLVPIIPFILASIFQCSPIDSYWTEGRPASKCYTDISGLYLNGGLNVFVDLALMTIVLPRVLELHLNTRQRWALVGIIALGSFAVIAGITRIARVGSVLEKENFDASWDTYDISIWTATEIYVSLICAAAPGVKPLISKILPKLLGTTLGSRSKTRTPGDRLDTYELNSTKYANRRGTIGSARVRKNTIESILEEADGPYEEVGRGVDDESEDRSPGLPIQGTERRIYKREESQERPGDVR